MSDSSHAAPTVTLSLPRGERWTLHHVLLDRIEPGAVGGGSDEPPAEAVFEAFDVLDGGGTRFSVDQLEAMRDVLATYHHSTTWWEVERPQVERLLHRVTDAIEAEVACAE